MRHLGLLRRARTLVLILGFALLSLPAAAEPDAAQKDAARALWRDGWTKYQAHDYAGALTSFQASHAIMGVPTTAVELAKTQAALRRLVEARETALQTTRYPKDDQEPPQFTAARDEAAALVKQLDARIPVLSIGLKGLPAGTRFDVKLDGTSLAQSGALVRQPANPGKHEIVASALGYHEVHRTVVLEEGKPFKLAIVLSPLDAPVPASPVVAHDPAPSHPSPETAPAPIEPAKDSRSIAPWIVGGVGVAGLAVGGILGAVVLSKKATTDAECNQVTLECPANAVSAADTGRTLGPISTAGFIVGGLGVGVSAVWLLTRAPAKSEAPRATVGMGPVVTASDAGWRLQGSW